MGIPYLFRDLVRSYPRIVRNRLPCAPDSLYVDFNGIVHTSAARVASSGRTWTPEINAEHEKRVIEETVRYYDEEVLTACRPRETSFLSVDGVASFAKIVQQRRRRFMHAFRADLERHAYASIGKVQRPRWDSNAITPGTEFMNQLHEELVAYANRSEVRTLVSGVHDRGEGETKIYEHMRREDAKSQGKVHVVYGLDADLIMMSLIHMELDDPGSRVYLMREASQMEFRDDQSFKFLDVGELRRALATTVLSGCGVKTVEDYVVASMLLGNDFVPHVTFLRLRTGGVRKLFDACARAARALGEQSLALVRREGGSWRIDAKAMRALFEALSSVEDAEMAELDARFQRATERVGNPRRDVDAYVEEYPIRNKARSLCDNGDVSGWRTSYYDVAFPGMRSRDKIDAVCAAYLRMLQWIVDSYLGHTIPDTFVAYQYTYSPTALDMYLHMSTHEASFADKADANEGAVSETFQLLMVLPPSSATRLLPEDIAAVATDPSLGCAHMYPDTCDVNTLHRDKLWECSLMLPRLEGEVVRAAHATACRQS
jgi:5'-3' exonuclease